MRIATWNTWWCFGPWEERQPLVSRALAEQTADIVLLQETWPEQAEAVAEACGLAVIALDVGPFERTSVDSIPPDRPFGNAVLGRPDAVKPAGSLPLDSPGDGAHRTAVAARIVGGDDHELLVVSTHLNHRIEAGEVRQRQLEAITGWLDDLHPNGPAVVGGDLNQTPYSEEYRTAVTGRWTDLWVAAHPDRPGSTMVPENPRFAETYWMAERNPPGAPPGCRFDYLLSRPGRPGSPTATVERIDLIGGAKHQWPSDHLGLVADIHVTD